MQIDDPARMKTVDSLFNRVVLHDPGRAGRKQFKGTAATARWRANRGRPWSEAQKGKAKRAAKQRRGAERPAARSTTAKSVPGPRDNKPQKSRWRPGPGRCA